MYVQGQCDLGGLRICSLPLDGGGRYRRQESANVGEILEVVVVIVVAVAAAVADPEAVVLHEVRVQRVLSPVEQLGQRYSVMTYFKVDTRLYNVANMV